MKRLLLLYLPKVSVCKHTNLLLSGWCVCVGVWVFGDFSSGAALY